MSRGQTARTPPKGGVRAWGGALALFGLAGVPACEAELGLLALSITAVGGAMWAVGRRRERLALAEPQNLRGALAAKDQRGVEQMLRKRLVQAADTDDVSPELEWLTRAQLGGLLVAEWRLDEAAEVYAAARHGLSPLLRDLANFGSHEVAVLTETPDEARLAAIRADRVKTLEHVPSAYEEQTAMVWGALEGLCLARMGRHREAVPQLEVGLARVMELTPARIVYVFHLAQSLEHLGDNPGALARYREATAALPGTRLANQAERRIAELERGTPGFRSMLPEAPGRPSNPALGSVGSDD